MLQDDRTDATSQLQTSNLPPRVEEFLNACINERDRGPSTSCMNVATLLDAGMESAVRLYVASDKLREAIDSLIATDEQQRRSGPKIGFLLQDQTRLDVTPVRELALELERECEFISARRENRHQVDAIINLAAIDYGKVANFIVNAIDEKSHNGTVAGFNATGLLFLLKSAGGDLKKLQVHTDSQLAPIYAQGQQELKSSQAQ